MRIFWRSIIFKKEYLIYSTFLVSALIIISGYYYYNHEKKRIEIDKYSELRTISELKINQLEQWLKERVGDANVSTKSPLFSMSVANWIINPSNKKNKDDILNRLALTKTFYNYEDLLLVSNTGHLFLSLTDSLNDIDSSTVKFINESIKTKLVVLSYFYKCTTRHAIHFDLFSPVLNQNKKVIAVLILRVNPYDYIYPLIKSWPTASKSAETLLVKQQGDSVIFLNELRHRKNTALNYKISLKDANLPATAGVIGKTGIFEGKDYRGVDVISDLRKIPGTPWIMVANIDRAEIFQDLYFRTGMIAAFVFLSILFVGSLSALTYRERQKNLFRDLYLKEKDLNEAQEEFKTTLYSIGDAVITTDQYGQVKHINEVGEKLTGWKETEARGKKLEQIFRILNEETRGAVQNPVKRILTEGTVLGLANHTILIHKDGKEIPITDSGSPIKNDNGEIIGVVLVFRDQTEDRATRKTLFESERRYRSLFENMLNGFAYCKMLYENGEPVDFIYLAVNAAFEKLTGLKNVVNKKVSDVIPGIKESDANLIEIYGRVAKTGVPEQFETLVESLNMWFSISVYSPQPKYFVAVFDVITERKNAEKNLKASEEKFRRTFELASIGKSLTGLDGKLTSINDSFCKMLGYTREELYVKDFLEITYPEDLELSGNTMKLLLNGEKKSHRMEKRYIRKDGSILWADVSTMLLNDSDGSPMFFVTHLIDITLRKEAEEKLKKREELLTNMGKAAKIGGWEFDTATLKGTWTKEVANIHELDPELETSAEIGLSFYHGEMKSQIEKAVKEAIEFGKPYDLELEMTTAKGNSKWVRTIGNPLIENGKTIKLHGSFQDITEKKLAENEINYLNSKLHNLISSIKELSSAHTLKSVQRIVATSARNLTSADGATIVFRDGDECYYADEDAISPLWKGKKFPLTSCISGWVMMNEKSAVIEDIYTDDRIPVDAYKPTFVKSLAMVPVKTNKALAAIGNYWKTNHKASELEIELLQTLADAAARAIENVRLYNDLEKRVDERTGQLLSANKELEAFSYSVSHDLRAPLRAIDGFTKMLVEGYKNKLDAEGERICSVIQDNAIKMGQLIDDLLAFSRLSRADINLSKIDMETLANSVYYELTTEAERNRINFELHNLTPIYGDPTMIRQTWVNLISNAIKFSSKKEKAEIEISEIDGDGIITYCIKDNGAGFSMKYVGKLFGVFQRLHTTKEFEGTGVGLAIVQRIIYKHGGKVWAEGEIDKGALFYFSIPKLNS